MSPAALEKIAGERKLTDRQKKFIQSRLDGFKTEKVDELEAELGKHIDRELGELKRIGGILGLEPEDGDVDVKGKKAKPKPGAEPDDSERSEKGDDEDEYLNSEKNPMLRRA